MLLAVVLAGGAFAAVPPRDASADALSDAIAKQKALEQQIAASKARIAALAASQAALSVSLSSTKATLADLNVNLAEVKTEIVQMTVTVAEAQASVDELDATIGSLDRQIEDLESQQRTKQDQLDARLETLASRIRDAYDTDRTSLLEALLSGSDFTDVLTEVGYHLDVAEQDKKLAEQIVADREVLAVIGQTVADSRTQADAMRTEAAAQKAELDGELADLADAKASLAALEAETARLLAEQQQQYAQMAKDKAAIEASLAAQLKAEKELDALIAKLLAQMNGIPAEFKGKFIWPMRGIITQEFGCTGFYLEPPYGDCAHFHRGIDIATTLYTPIKAAAAGKVMWAGKSPYDSSWVVIIAHAKNLVSYYYHIDNYTHPPAVKAGDYVAQGQVIAYEGLTGNTTGPHLHWGVQLNGTWTNPRWFL
jgi:murein DD-endopeptidase MepM/ murein hydrolase activator NlpD